MLRKLNKEDGAVTVEATISLTAFMFAIVTILSIINICMVQAKISSAINATAKEISQYSYLYSLSGINESEKKLSEAAKADTENINKILSDVNTVFNEVENLGNTGNKSLDDIPDISKAWDDAVGSAEKIKEAGSSLEETFKDIASDPKKLMFGIAKLVASESLELAKSKLIAGPLSKVMCKKHLVSSKDGNVEATLRYYRVIPSTSGSYLDGLDFSESTLFPYGSGLITVDVEYKVNVIALLPIDYTLTFHQTASTYGWLTGEKSFTKAKEYEENNTLWTKSTIEERANLIRHMGIKDMCADGYAQTTGLTDVQLYNKDTNQFAMIASMNPLWSAEGTPPKTLDDLDEKALQKSIELLCGKIKSTTDGLSKVTTKTEKDGTTTKTSYDCKGATNKIVLVIPEDPGLKEKIEAIVEKAKKGGVIIEVVASYGTGTSQIESTTTQEDKK